MLTKQILDMLPNCRLVSTVKQEEDEAGWLAARTKGIGGSDIGAICGVSPFSSAKQVYFKKVGMYEDTFTPNDAAKERMLFGHLLEPIVADEYSRRTGRKLINLNCTVCHKDYPWALANIDRLIVEEIETEDGTIILKPVGILECKTTSEYCKDEWDAGDLLESYIYQLNWYLWILGLEVGAFACIAGGNSFYEYTIFRNDELINNIMLPAADHFWHNNVLALVEPEMQHTDTEIIKTLYADCKKGSEVMLEDETDNDLLDTIVQCKAEIKRLENIKTEAENRIKDRLKDNEIGISQDYVVKWSPRSQTRVDTDLLKMNYPQIYDAVKKQVNFRVMTIKG